MERRTDPMPEAATFCLASSPSPAEGRLESSCHSSVVSESAQSQAGHSSSRICWDIQAVFFPPCSIAPIFLRIALFTMVFTVLLAVGTAVSLGKVKGLTSLLRLSGMGLTGLSVLALAITILVFRQPLTARYILDDRGVRLYLLSHGPLGTRLLTTMAGWLTGIHRREGTEESPSPFSWAGRGPLWMEVRGIIHHPEENLILLKLPFLGFVPIRCLPENYSAVAALVDERTHRAQSRDPANEPAPPRVFSVTRRLGHSFLAVFAFLLLRTLPLDVPDFIPPIILAAALVTLWIRPVRRVAAGFLLTASLTCITLAVLDGFKARKLFDDPFFKDFLDSTNFALCEQSPDWVLEAYTHFGDMTPGEWFAAAVASSGLCYFLWLGLTRVRESGSRPR